MRVSWRLIAGVCSRHGRTEGVDAICAPGACGESADGEAPARTEKRRRDVPPAAVNRVLFGVERPDASPGVCEPTESPSRPCGGVSPARGGSRAHRARRVTVRRGSPQTLGKQGGNNKTPADIASEGPVKQKPQTDSSGASRAPQSVPGTNHRGPIRARAVADAAGPTVGSATVIEAWAGKGGPGARTSTGAGVRGSDQRPHEGHAVGRRDRARVDHTGGDRPSRGGVACTRYADHAAAAAWSRRTRRASVRRQRVQHSARNRGGLWSKIRGPRRKLTSLSGDRGCPGLRPFSSTGWLGSAGTAGRPSSLTSASSGPRKRAPTLPPRGPLFLVREDGFIRSLAPAASVSTADLRATKAPPPRRRRRQCPLHDPLGSCWRAPRFRVRDRPRRRRIHRKATSRLSSLRIDLAVAATRGKLRGPAS